MADSDSVPTQVLEKAGVRASAVHEIEKIIANSKPSNLVMDRDGKVIGRMVLGPDGKSRVEYDDGKRSSRITSGCNGLLGGFARLPTAEPQVRYADQPIHVRKRRVH